LKRGGVDKKIRVVGEGEWKIGFERGLILESLQIFDG